ncbi:DUF4837 family protein [Flavobacterium silvaticum]|uniref:DUF4837 family protein n=1 Tax=Flavobacterium silvaticum TaxID=1852020 RepID=A0A972FTY0_9FLAO|nr:DUF4837 family protein [Flavobacterium silvaticum]NMH28433.1 DUF4837 family protein [Flavobacterium silvaticum]
MKKALFFWLIAIVLSGCGKTDDSRKTEAADKLNSVAVIIDDNLWLGTIGDSLRNKLAAPMTGLDQEEPLFTLNQYPAKLLEGYMTHSRNIIVIKKNDKLTQNVYQVKRDQYTRPQTIFSISGKTTADIIQTLEMHAPDMIARIRAVEIAESQKSIKNALADDKDLEKMFRIRMNYPKSYKTVLKRRKFIWLKKEITSGSSSILVYQIPEWQIGISNDMDATIIRQRNAVIRKYIRGTRRNTPMVTENSFTPYFNEITLAGKPAYEMRGTWELANDFMQGPFLSYCIHDKLHRRYVFVEGFCYAPSREKRDLMFELEAILRTVSFMK